MIIKVTQTSETNYYEELPMGEIYLGEHGMTTVKEFIARYDLDVIGRDGDTISVEAEWGNGEGTDTFEITITHDPHTVLADVLTASEAAQVWGLAEATVRQAINRGQLPARKSANVWLVTRDSITWHWGAPSAQST